LDNNKNTSYCKQISRPLVQAIWVELYITHTHMHTYTNGMMLHATYKFLLVVQCLFCTISNILAFCYSSNHLRPSWKLPTNRWQFAMCGGWSVSRLATI